MGCVQNYAAFRRSTLKLENTGRASAFPKRCAGIDLDVERERVPFKALFRGRTIIFRSIRIYSWGIALDLENERVPFKALLRDRTIIFPSISVYPWEIDLDLEEQRSRFKRLFRGWTIIFPSISLCS
jgi:hypothetical protein